MTWQPQGRSISAEKFGTFEPQEILYEFEGPHIFTFLGAEDELLLAYHCAESDEFASFLVVPTDQPTVDAIRQGHKPMLDALRQPWAWVVEQNNDSSLSQAWATTLDSLPASALPQPGICLNPAHEPLLTVRMVGEGLSKEDGIPASVITRAVDGASTALKALVDWAIERTGVTGRPEASIRTLYDLPAYRFRFASFEVSFAEPKAGESSDSVSSIEDRETMALVGKALRRGLEWAVGDDAPSWESLPEGQALLAALKNLVPPKHGQVKEVHLSGRLIGSTSHPFVMDRRVTDRVRLARKAILPEVEPMVEHGFIRQFDKDRSTFSLRDPEGAIDLKCVISEENFDDAFSAFTEDERVVIVGFKSLKSGLINVVQIAPYPMEPSSPETSP